VASDNLAQQSDAVQPDSVQRVFEIILDRRTNPTAGSYTASLFEAGENEILKKIGEEAVEVIIAAKGETDERLISELTDLLYHSLVLLAGRNLAWADVQAELARRIR
jgi:phosphoribosyl-ATP pyrophosphohydrolase